MFRRLCVLILAAAPVVAFAAASKEMQELQRDVALLQEQVRQLQQSQDKQLAASRAGAAGRGCRQSRRHRGGRHPE